MKPFKQLTISEGVFIREFSGDVDPEELVWHRDLEDRVITVAESLGWKLQLDNQMPVNMRKGDQFFIPALEWHRVIKGHGSLLIEVDTKAAHPRQYNAPQGSKRDKQLDQTKKDFEKAKQLRKDGKTQQAKELEQRAYNRRDRMEKKERKNESIELTEAQLRELIHDVLEEELSAKTKKSLDKKAEKRGLTKGSVYKEFEKGLKAFATSGSRKGMTAHQWAHARVNSATPSKKWAVVKKSKAKKK
jgi:hypothetical protein